MPLAYKCRVEETLTYLRAVKKSIETSSYPDAIRRHSEPHIKHQIALLLEWIIEQNVPREVMHYPAEVARSLMPPPDMSNEPFYSAPV